MRNKVQSANNLYLSATTLHTTINKMNNKNTVLGVIVVMLIIIVGYFFFSYRISGNSSITKIQNIQEQEVTIEIEFVEIDINSENSQKSMKKHFEKFPKRYQKGTNEWINKERYFPVYSFCLGKYEITNKQFSIFLNAYKSDVVKNSSTETSLILIPNIGLEKSLEGWKPKPDFEDIPVVNVTHAGVKEFCDYFGFDLPSNKEVSFIQRRTFPKNDWSDFKEPLPIGSKKPNILGIYDLDGNVHEICGYAHGNPSGPNFTYMGGIKSQDIRNSEPIYINKHASDLAGFRVSGSKEELEKNESYKIIYQRELLKEIESPKQIDHMREAWDAYNNEEYKSAIKFSDRAISNYSEEALQIQSGLLICPEYKDLGDTEKLLLFEAYILNDVAVAHYIKGESYVNLFRQSNETKKEYWNKAKETFYELFNFECGVCWDKSQQLFWSPNDVIIERYGIK